MFYSMKRCFITSMQLLSIFFIPEKYCSAVVENYSPISELDGLTQKFIEISDQEDKYVANDLVGQAKHKGNGRYSSNRIRVKNVYSDDELKRVARDHSRRNPAASDKSGDIGILYDDPDCASDVARSSSKRKRGVTPPDLGRDFYEAEETLRRVPPQITTEGESERRQQDGRKFEYLPSVEMWCLDKGKMLRDGLRGWESKAGWTLFWDLDYDYPILAPVCFQGVFEKALEDLANAYGDAERPFYLDIYPQQKLAVVSN